MDSDRHHRTGSTSSSTTSELFICFTSRLSSSSSSMKISGGSKSSSVHSPGRSRDHPTSLSTSLSRRLRHNGSLKGWQASPMFPTGGNKKRGGAFENPEPSSPKVTCIGQVRVKTKKQRKKLQRRHTGEFSFRKVELRNQDQNRNPNQNQSYQQSICEALRSIGAEFSCLLPCKSWCFSTGEREKEDRGMGSSEQSSCGAVFRGWLVSMHDDGEEEKRRDIELVVAGEDEEEEEAFPVRNSRRHVFDNLEIEDLMPKLKKDHELAGEEEGRVSICVPPKNALLLMRCRSDPVKMADLTNRFWDSSVKGNDEDEDGDGEAAEYEKQYASVKEFEVIDEGSEERDSVEVNEEQLIPEAESKMKMEILDDKEEENAEEDLQPSENQIVIEEVNPLIDSSFEPLTDLERIVNEKNNAIEETKEDEESRVSHSSCSLHSAEEENETEEREKTEESILQKQTRNRAMEETTMARERSDLDPEDKTHEKKETVHGTEFDKTEREKSPAMVERESEKSRLPDCLLLMMCEPKLSMEVSRETWVCSTDFIRWQPEKKVKQNTGGDKSKKRVSTDSKSITTQTQPPRSSCSFQAPVPKPSPEPDVPMATVIEQKLVNAVGCEPFVLTRCKSAPMRPAASKAPQDSCFWKNRNLEPHRRSSVGVSTAGIGF